MGKGGFEVSDRDDLRWERKFCDVQLEGRETAWCKTSEKELGRRDWGNPQEVSEIGGTIGDLGKAERTGQRAHMHGGGGDDGG
jgi:hypothetical protein